MQDGPRFTDREWEIKRMLESGMSRRAIAAVLGIAEHTVARMVQHIHQKLAAQPRRAEQERER